MEITLILIPLMTITKCCRGEILTEGQRWLEHSSFIIFILIMIIIITNTMIIVTNMTVVTLMMTILMMIIKERVGEILAEGQRWLELFS